MAFVYQIIKSDSTRGGCCGYKSPPGAMAFVYQISKSDSTRGGSWGARGHPRCFGRFCGRSSDAFLAFFGEIIPERNLVSALKHSGDLRFSVRGEKPCIWAQTQWRSNNKKRKVGAMMAHTAKHSPRIGVSRPGKNPNLTRASPG